MGNDTNHRSIKAPRNVAIRHGGCGKPWGDWSAGLGTGSRWASVRRRHVDCSVRIRDDDHGGRDRHRVDQHRTAGRVREHPWGPRTRPVVHDV